MLCISFTNAGIIDSSGIRITATQRLRQYDSGVLQTGAIVNKLQFIPPHEKNFLSRHSCSQQCLEKVKHFKKII